MIDTNLEFPDVMVDIETTGTDVGLNAILQIAAVKFNLEKGTVSHEFFDRCLTIAPRRAFDEDCRNNFWSKHTEVLQSIWGRGEDPLTVLTAFRDWAGPGMRFWGKPTHFDFSFIQNYFTQYDMHMPFHYRYAEDMNTWIRARFWPLPPPDFERDLEFTGELHNGLYDALHQVKVLFAAKAATTGNQLVIP
jgi:hypothetical protein